MFLVIGVIGVFGSDTVLLNKNGLSVTKGCCRISSIVILLSGSLSSIFFRISKLALGKSTPSLSWGKLILK